MSYSKDVGEVSARYRPAGEVPSVTYPAGTHVVFTAPGSATNGQYGLFEWNMTGTRGGADPHFHKTFSESFYVMEGTVRLFNGETSNLMEIFLGFILFLAGIALSGWPSFGCDRSNSSSESRECFAIKPRSLSKCLWESKGASPTR